MKTAEEWAKELDPQMSLDDEDNCIIIEWKHIKQIQLDAWKQGMMDAVCKCVETAQELKDKQLYYGSCELCAERIEKLKFERTEL